jgi:hypothetical protein
MVSTFLMSIPSEEKRKWAFGPHMAVARKKNETNKIMVP